MWLPGGMVDAADSKSAVGNNVRVRVSGEPPLLRKQSLNPFSLVKTFFLKNVIKSIHSGPHVIAFFLTGID